jgi:hypothetical protein
MPLIEFSAEARCSHYAFIESFNGRVRDELLNLEEFGSLREAQVLTEPAMSSSGAYAERAAADLAHRWSTERAHRTRARPVRRGAQNGTYGSAARLNHESVN